MKEIDPNLIGCIQTALPGPIQTPQFTLVNPSNFPGAYLDTRQFSTAENQNLLPNSSCSNGTNLFSSICTSNTIQSPNTDFRNSDLDNMATQFSSGILPIQNLNPMYFSDNNRFLVDTCIFPETLRTNKFPIVEFLPRFESLIDVHKVQDLLINKIPENGCQSSISSSKYVGLETKSPLKIKSKLKPVLELEKNQREHPQVDESMLFKISIGKRMTQNSTIWENRKSRMVCVVSY